jgi:hypothetical protein
MDRRMLFPHDRNARETQWPVVVALQRPLTVAQGPLSDDGAGMMHSDIHSMRHAEANATIDARRLSVWDHVVHGLLPGYRSERCGGAGGGAGGEAGGEAGREATREASRTRRPSRMAAYAPSLHVQVEVIERLSATSVAVLWQDATRCRYDDQVWISCRARLKGYCVLTGAVIRRDDLIYKPRVRTTTPANATAMILASVMEKMPAIAGCLR